MSADADFADPKAIGLDVETLVVDAVDALEHADDQDDHHDAVATSLLDPALVDVGVPVFWAGVATVEAGTRLEIKAAKREISNGTGSTCGRWLFKGRDGGGQHARLLEDGSAYLLALYDEPAARDSRRLLALVVEPASIVDEHLLGSWSDVDRDEETIAKLAWNSLIDADAADYGVKQ